MARKVNLTVNNIPIAFNTFVEGYVYQIAVGIVASLKGTSAIKTLELDIDSDDLVTMVLNGEGVSLTEYPMQIIRNTLAGMISNFKGVESEMSTLSLRISQ